MTEHVVLIDEDDAPLGEGEKLAVHREGKLHRAFSVFAFDGEGRLLLQRRAVSKYHSGGLWTNTCCGHPRPGEATEDAARRRLREEMGMDCGELVPAGIYRYRAEIVDLVENELDHLYVTTVSEPPDVNPDEVCDYRFVELDELAAWIDTRPEAFTAWFPPAWRIAASSAAQPSEG
jgi:isopentenyl-diphosphate Delta-isomerase